MKKFSLILVFTLLFFNCKSTAQIIRDSPVQVVLLAGQSNMAGAGNYEELDDSEIKRIEKVSNRVSLSFNGKPAKPLSYYDNRPSEKNNFLKRFGPELFIGLTLAEANPNRHYLLIKRSQGGTALYGAWNPNWSTEKAKEIEKGHKKNLQLYNLHVADINRNLKQLKNQGKSYKIIGMAWMQGENDAILEVSAKGYMNNLKKLVSAYRSEFNVPEMPFVLGQINSRYGIEGGAEMVRQNMVKFVNQDYYSELIRTSTDTSWSDFPKHSDNVHYNAEGNKRLGVAFADALSKKVNESISKEPITNLNLFPDHGLTDPHTIIDDGKLYLFGGHDKSWETTNTWLMDRWEIWSTDNLIDWKQEDNIFPTDTYIGDKPNCWAGDITKKGDKYFWYFSNRNIDTGVMVSDSPSGPFKDALGKPLLPKDIIKGHPYDPEIFEENGVYTMFFGAGYYYAVTLGDDMISLADEPQPVVMQTKEGEKKWTADKSTVFKRNNIYYLVWGPNYAMSKNLRGPYIYEGKFLAGGHNNVFQWKGQWYAVMENKDISLFYRGISLKPLNFNEDGTIIIPKNDSGFPNNGRFWSFDNSEMGWKTISGNKLEWDKKGTIKGEISGNTILESSMWLSTDLKKYNTLELSIKNISEVNQARISIASYNMIKGEKFWSEPNIDWENEAHVLIDLKPNKDEFSKYKIDVSKLSNIKSFLKQLRIEPAIGANEGNWEIEYISIK